MAEAFDPYRKWLGIPQDEQPPHHYRLLGIALYEDDPDVIENAADRQMAHVRTYQNGKHAALSQKILNELAAAKLMLLQEEKKATYDEELREAEQPLPPPPEEAAPLPEENAEGEPAEDSNDELASLSGIGRPPVRGRGVATVGPQAKVAVVKAPSPARRPAGSAVTTKASRGSVMRTRRKKNSPMLFVFSGVGLLFAVILVVIVVAMQGGQSTDEVTGGETKPTENSGGLGPRPFERPQEDEGGQNNGSHENTGEGSGGNFPEVGSEAPSDPVGPRLQTFDEYMTGAREALADRDKEKVDELLGSARRLARSRGEREQLAHLEALHSFTIQFWQDVVLGARKLDRLDEDDEERAFELNQVKYEFLELDRGQVTMRIDGTEQTWKLRELPAREALYLSNKGRRNEHASQVFQAAFLLLDGEREDDLPLGQRRILARLLYQLSAPSQGENEFLAREIEDAGLEPIVYVPAEATPPTDPPEDESPSEEDTASDDDPDTGDDPADEPDEPGDDDPEVAGDPEDEPSEEEVAEEDPRSPLPADTDLATAAGVVVDEFRGDISAASRSPEAKAELIRRLMLTASTENEDRALRYAYLERARDLARGMGHTPLMLEVIAEMGKSYRIDVLFEQAQAMRVCGTNIDSEESYEKFVDATCDLCLLAIEEDREDIMAQLNDTLVSTAARLRVSPQRAQSTGRWFVEYAQIIDKVEEAKAILEENPEDPEANQTLGIFLCFFQEDFDDGLPLLGKAKDQALRQLAVESEDLPTDAEPRIAVADRWMQLAQHGNYGTAVAQSMVRVALGHYRYAERKLPRREKLEMQQQIRNIQSALDNEQAYMPRK